MNISLLSIIRAVLNRIHPQSQSQHGLATQAEFQFDAPAQAGQPLPQRNSRIHLNLAERDPTRLLATIEEALAGEPGEITIELIGPGILLHDNALMLFEELRNRPAHTRLHVRARTCLIDGAILLWLAGDTRSMREDGWIQLSAAQGGLADADGTDGGVSLLIEDEEPANTDLRSIHRHIGEWLPVHEITGRRLFENELREFGLLEDAESQRHLASLFQAEPVCLKEGSVTDKTPEESPR